MGTKTPRERQIERRIAAHVRQLMVEHQLGVNAISRKLKVHKSYVSRLLSEERGADASFVAAVHKELGISANVLLDDDPPPHFWQPGPPSAEK